MGPVKLTIGGMMGNSFTVVSDLGVMLRFLLDGGVLLGTVTV